MPSTKVQRWIDLLAAMLAHRLPVTFDQLVAHVPAYLEDGSVAADGASPTLKRMFERDKVELRDLGVPIETLGEDGSEEMAYRLRPNAFYLPYLAIVADRGVKAPVTVDRYGFRSLETLAFEPDELVAIVEAARQVAQVGDPQLADEARSAIRKLAFDLPLGVADGPGDTLIVAQQPSADPDLLATLGDALFRRKRMSFRYRAMEADGSAVREVEPYGLFFTGGHWYLAARDVARDGLRNFRVSRMLDPKVNSAKAATPDYTVPGSFALREHAGSRQAWEIGDGDAFDATVEFRGHAGAVRAAAALGEPVTGSETMRRFRVRRCDSFARWLLSFGGDAMPVSPEPLQREFRALVCATGAVYAS